MARDKGNSVKASMVYKTLERYVVMAFQMLVQIVIARILSPSDYGLVAMMIVFIAIATVFIQNGFNMALVQKKDADETDFSTALILNLAIGIVLYAVLVIFTPSIASFYGQPYINTCLPVLGLLLVFGSVNSIQIAIANRRMQFRSLFNCSVVASVVSGALGIAAAYARFGVWALILQQLSNSVVLAVMLLLQQHWVPRLTFRSTSAKELFSFGWKLLLAGLINQAYKELNSLVIGKKYTSSDLAFYTKGNQYPKYVTMGIDSSIGSVMFAAFSKNQDNKEALFAQMKKAITINSYLVFPILAIMAMAAKPLVVVLLTEKWLPIVPFIQICSITCAFHPLESTQLQAIAAVGRSDVRLKLEFVKKSIGIILLLLALNYGPIAIALSTAITGLIGVFAGAVAGKMVHGYPLRHLISDLGPTIFVSSVMCFALYFCGKLEYAPFISLLIQSVTGIGVYLLFSWIFKVYGFVYFLQLYKNRRT